LSDGSAAPTSRGGSPAKKRGSTPGEQYEGVRRVLEIADFVEETDLVGPDWQGLRRMLRRTIQYDAPYVHAVETRPPTGGVTVCDIDDLKYDSRKAVFLLDLIDETYPGEQFLTQLFPTAWLREMPAYPAVTNPSPESIADTFATLDVRETTESSSTAQQNAKRSADAADIGDPFETYHAQRSGGGSRSVPAPPNAPSTAVPTSAVPAACAELRRVTLPATDRRDARTRTRGRRRRRRRGDPRRDERP